MVAINRSLEKSLLGLSVERCNNYKVTTQSPSSGMDSEFWGEVNLGDGWQLIPGFEFLPWDKGKYIKLNAFANQVWAFNEHHSRIGNDGILAEIAPDHDWCRQTFLSSIGSSIAGVAWQLRNWLVDNNEGIVPKYGENYRLSVTPVTREFDLEWLQSLPEKYRILGCAPSLNAFGAEYRVAPEDFCEEVATRALGTHIHLGVNTSSAADFQGNTKTSYELVFEYPDILISLLELFVNIPLTWYWKNHSEELAERRKTYGEAGCYRQTEYGVEWRALPSLVLSSPWLYHAIYGMVRNVFHFAQKVIAFEDFERLERIWDVAGIDRVREIINTSDWEAARDFVTRYDHDYWKVHHHLSSSRTGPGFRRAIWDIFKFLADRPEMRRGEDFNTAWKLAAIMDTFENSQQWMADGYTFNTYLRYGYWGRLSESGPINEFLPRTPEAHTEAEEFLSSLGFAQHPTVLEHKVCGTKIQNDSAKALSCSLRNTLKSDDYESFWIHYCPTCNAATRTEEWKSVDSLELTGWVFD